MNNSSVVDRLLMNLDNLHEPGRLDAFALGNPFYSKYTGDGEYYTKELPTGEAYLVALQFVFDENDRPIAVHDNVILRKR